MNIFTGSNTGVSFAFSVDFIYKLHGSWHTRQYLLNLLIYRSMFSNLSFHDSYNVIKIQPIEVTHLSFLIIEAECWCRVLRQTVTILTSSLTKPTITHKLKRSMKNKTLKLIKYLRSYAFRRYAYAIIRDHSQDLYVRTASHIKISLYGKGEFICCRL